MSETNLFFHAIQEALNAHIERMVAEATRPLQERIRKLEAYEIMLTDHHDGMLAMRERITALETKLTEAKLFEQTTNVTIPIDEARMVEALNGQEWFWDKVRGFVDAGVESAMDDHTSSYDHDDYDRMYNEWGSEDVSDFVKDSDIEDTVEEKVRDILHNASLSISL
jgi:hypothetical protein